jgi:Tol biopolymer transport system component
MSLPAGTRLGPYEIVSAIGAGGMGEVYRARDSQLHRDVAIKVLPDRFAADPDRLARFEREARVLAALNHRHIASIFGIAEGEGLRGLVLELVDGPTLGERIAAGPLTLAETLVIAAQIADALDASHQKGIIHRDLKPANVKVTPDGSVKVLDFGLAKTYETRTSEGDDLTTVSAPLTRDAAIIGTTAYMSPEQARGQAVDKRTDIWSFGCVLFEMLTRRRVFSGETTSDTIAAILQREPDWSALPPGTPPGLLRVLKRCLEKDSKRRLRDAGDLRTELEDALRIGPPVAAPSPGAAPSRRRYLVGGTAAIGALALTAVMLAPWSREAPPPEPALLRSTLVLPPHQRLDHRGGDYPLALSPDGRQVIYGGAVDGRVHLYVRDLSQFEPTLLSGTEGAQHPFFSPDGRAVAFFANGVLQQLPVSGGTPLRICAIEGNARGGSWGPNDTIVFATDRTTLSMVSARGGTPQRIPNAENANWPQILPDGKTVLFTIQMGAVATIALDGTAKRVLGRTATFQGGGPLLASEGGIMQARYLPTGHLVYGQGVRVLGVPFDITAFEITGAPVALIEHVFRAQGFGAVYFAISSTGVLVYAPDSSDYELSWVGRDGRAASIGAARRPLNYSRVSPDGARIAAMVVDEARRPEIWLFDSVRGTGAPLAREQRLLPVWSPDSRHIAFHSARKIMRQPASAAGPADVLLASAPGTYPTAWAPDGRTLLLNQVSPAGAGADLWALDVGTKTARALLTGPSNQSFGRFSPDGRWIAYMDDESGRYEINVMAYPAADQRITVSTNGGIFPVWSHDGREIFYRQEFAVLAVPVNAGAELRVGKPQVLFEGPYIGFGADFSFDVGPDGRFLMIKGDNAAMGRQLNIVTNWFEDVKRLIDGRYFAR